MNQDGEKTRKERELTDKSIFTIPNLLSLARICMLPFIIWAYTIRNCPAQAGALLLLSAVTDMADGYIARRFQMISNVGKVLDPVADKLTQATVMLCLMERYPAILIPFLFMVLKELFMSATGWMVMRKTQTVMGACWHGKAATCAIHGMILLHLFWASIPRSVSSVFIAVCCGMIALSFALYARRNYRALRSSKRRAEK